MTLNKSNCSISICFHPACLCLTGLGGSAFMFMDSLVWAFPRALDVYVPFVTLTSQSLWKCWYWRLLQGNSNRIQRRKNPSLNSMFPSLKTVKRTAWKTHRKCYFKFLLEDLEFPFKAAHLPTSVLSQGWGLPALSASSEHRMHQQLWAQPVGCLLLCLLLLSGSFSRAGFASNQGFCH